MKTTVSGRSYFNVSLSIYLIVVILVENIIESLPIVAPNLEIKEGEYDSRLRNIDSNLNLPEIDISKLKPDVVPHQQISDASPNLTFNAESSTSPVAVRPDKSSLVLPNLGGTDPHPNDATGIGIHPEENPFASDNLSPERLLGDLDQGGADTNSAPSNTLRNTTINESKSQGNDIPDEFRVHADHTKLSDSDESKDQDAKNVYLDAPPNNADKLEEDAAHIPAIYGDTNNNIIDFAQSNRRIMDDNNEQAVYNGEGGDALGGKTTQREGGGWEEMVEENEVDKEGESATDDGDYSDYSDADLYMEGGGKDKGHGENGENGNAEDIQIDEELDFKMKHLDKPELEGPDAMFSSDNSGVKEGIVDSQLVKSRSSLNTPSSVVLFYTWVILIALVAVLMFSTYRYRCQAIGPIAPRNFRFGNHSNTRPGEEKKRLLDNVYE